MGTLKETVDANLAGHGGRFGPFVSPQPRPRNFAEATVDEATAVVVEQMKAAIRDFQASHPRTVPEALAEDIVVDGVTLGRVEVTIYRRWDLHLGYGGEIGGDLAESIRQQVYPQIEVLKLKHAAQGD